MAKTMDDDKQYELKYTGDIDNITLVGGDPFNARLRDTGEKLTARLFGDPNDPNSYVAYASPEHIWRVPISKLYDEGELNPQQRLERDWRKSPMYGFDKVMLGSLAAGVTPFAAFEALPAFMAAANAASDATMATGVGQTLGKGIATYGPTAMTSIFGPMSWQHLASPEGIAKTERLRKQFTEEPNFYNLVNYGASAAGDAMDAMMFAPLAKPLTYMGKEAWNTGKQGINTGIAKTREAYDLLYGNKLTDLNYRTQNLWNKANNNEALLHQKYVQPLEAASNKAWSIYWRRGVWSDPKADEIPESILNQADKAASRAPRFSKMSEENIANFLEKSGVDPSEAKSLAAKYNTDSGLFEFDYPYSINMEFNPSKVVTTGDITLKDLATGKQNTFNLDFTNTGGASKVTYNPKYNKVEVTSTDSGRLIPNMPVEYQEAMQRNIDYVTNDILPGSKIFGSSSNIAKGNLMHGSHDIDVIMPESLARQHAEFRNWNQIRPDTYTYHHSKAGDIDVNVIRQTPDGRATGDLAHELYSQLYPKQYRDLMLSEIKKGNTPSTSIPLNISADELYKAYDPVTKGIADTFASHKGKHAGRALYYLHYGNIDDVERGFNAYANYILGGEYKPSNISLDTFNDPVANAKIIDEFFPNVKGINKEEFIHDPRRMKLLLDYNLLDSMFLGRGVDANNGNIVKSLTYWFPDTYGGTAKGVGLNTVVGSDSGYGDVYASIVPNRFENYSGSLEDVRKSIEHNFGKIPLSDTDKEIVQSIAKKHGIVNMDGVSTLSETLNMTAGHNGQNYKDFIKDLANHFNIPAIENGTFGSAPYASLLEDQSENAIKQFFFRGMDRPQTAIERAKQADGINYNSGDVNSTEVRSVKDAVTGRSRRIRNAAKDNNQSDVGRDLLSARSSRLQAKAIAKDMELRHRAFERRNAISHLETKQYNLERRVKEIKDMINLGLVIGAASPGLFLGGKYLMEKAKEGRKKKQVDANNISQELGEGTEEDNVHAYGGPLIAQANVFGDGGLINDSSVTSYKYHVGDVLSDGTRIEKIEPDGQGGGMVYFSNGESGYALIDNTNRKPIDWRTYNNSVVEESYEEEDPDGMFLSDSDAEKLTNSFVQGIHALANSPTWNTTGGAGYIPNTDIVKGINGAIYDYMTGGLPIDTVRQRLYDNLYPYGYQGNIDRVRKAIKNNIREEDVESGYDPFRDAIWATYLNIPENRRHEEASLSPLRKSKYVPTKGGNNDTYYAIDLTKGEKQLLYEKAKKAGLAIGENGVFDVLSHYFGDHTIGRGKDDRGEYISYYDLWDLSPYSKDNGQDESLGIGNPVHFYDRIYLDELPQENYEYDKGGPIVAKANMFEMGGPEKQVIKGNLPPYFSYDKEKDEYISDYWSDEEDAPDLKWYKSKAAKELRKTHRQVIDPEGGKIKYVPIEVYKAGSWKAKGLPNPLYTELVGGSSVYANPFEDEIVTGDGKIATKAEGKFDFNGNQLYETEDGQFYTDGSDELYSEGGPLNTYKQWNDLSIKERAEMMKVAIKNGITNLSDIKNKYNEFALGGHVYSGVNTATQKMQNMDWMKGPVYDVLPRLFRMAGISVQVTSGKRNARYDGDHSHHIEGNAVDIIPLGKSTFEDIENAAYTNPLIRSYMLEHKLGILDETGRTPESIALMKKTKATGPHLHFGIDSKPAAAYAARFNGNTNSSNVNSKWEKRAESYWNRAQPMYQEMLDAGINPVAAAGILGNIAQESAFNPYASNNISGGHWGYLQNDKNIHPWMTTHYGNDHTGQMNYIVAGLQGRLPKDNMGLDKRFNSFNAKMNGVTDPEMAAYLWEREYERSANENIPERKYFAKYFYDKMMGNNQGSHLPSREIENPYFDFTPQNPELLQQAMSGNTPDYTQDYNNYALAARNAVLEDKLAQQQEEQARAAESAVRAAQRQKQMGLLSYVMNMYSPERSQSPYIGVFNLLANNGQGDNIAAYGGHLFETGGPEKYRRVLPPYSTDGYHVEVPDAISPRAIAISPIVQDVSRDAAIDRTNRVYSNYSEAKDSPLSNTQEAFYNSLRYLKDNVWDSIPSGVSNCTLTASQWIDPSNPVKNASSIVNNPSTYGYTKINDLDAIPGDLLIAKVPDKDSYHSMLITGFTDKDGVYEMNGKKFKYKKGEPLLTYSRGGHDTSFIRKGVPLSVYTANSDGHTDNLYYRYNYPNEVFLPPIEVYPR